MKSTKLDCMGLNCPQPVLKTKEALEQGYTEIEVLVDNEGSMQNVSRFGGSRGCTVESEPLADGTFRIVLRGGKMDADAFNAEAYSCDVPNRPQVVYVIASDTMGRGSDELGWGLLQTFIQTIKDVTPLPTKIIFYNGGVKIVTQESGALSALQALQDKGVEVMACGTCLDFFQLKSAIKIGQISNMYDIMDAMSRADKVISPL